MKELLLGCGFSRKKLMAQPGHELVFDDVTTLDINRKCSPDIAMDLNIWHGKAMTPKGEEALSLGRYLRENYFDEIHAYEVLEHLGSLGNARIFFSDMGHLFRTLKPGGFLFGTCPSRYSGWLWGDPSHRRAILPETLVFLSQKEIKRNREAGTAMSDFSDIWSHDFEVIAAQDNHKTFAFCLRANK